MSQLQDHLEKFLVLHRIDFTAENENTTTYFPLYSVLGDGKSPFFFTFFWTHTLEITKLTKNFTSTK